MSVTPAEAGTGAAPMNSTLDVEAFARAVASPLTPHASSLRPWIIRLSPGDIDRFEACCRDWRITLIDTIDRQLMDLAVVRLPSASSGADRQRFVEDTVADGLPTATGSTCRGKGGSYTCSIGMRTSR